MTSKLGRTFLEYSKQGLLVPDDLTVEMWQQNMRECTVLKSDYKPNVGLLRSSTASPATPTRPSSSRSTSTCS